MALSRRHLQSRDRGLRQFGRICLYCDFVRKVAANFQNAYALQCIWLQKSSWTGDQGERDYISSVSVMCSRVKVCDDALNVVICIPIVPEHTTRGKRNTVIKYVEFRFEI